MKTRHLSKVKWDKSVKSVKWDRLKRFPILRSAARRGSSGTKQSLLTRLRSKATARQASAAMGLAFAGLELPSGGSFSPAGSGDVSSRAWNGARRPANPQLGQLRSGIRGSSSFHGQEGVAAATPYQKNEHPAQPRWCVTCLAYGFPLVPTFGVVWSYLAYLVQFGALWS